MLAAIDVVERLKKLKITAVHIRLRARGGTGDKAPDQVLNLPSELLLVMVLKSAELKTSPQFQLTQLEEKEVEKVADCDYCISISISLYIYCIGIPY